MQRGMAQPQTIQIARCKAFDEHVPVSEHTQQQIAPRGGGDIESDAALVRVKSEKKRTAVWVWDTTEKQRFMARRIAAPRGFKF